MRLTGARVRLERLPQIGARFGRDSGQERRGAVRKLKRGRHDADDRHRLIVERQRRAERRRVAVEVLAPEHFADDGDGGRVVRPERPAAKRRHAEHLEEPGVGSNGHHPFRLPPLRRYRAPAS